MKKVVIIGAFDRYNYGDNLMPILFEMFLLESYPGFFEKYKLIFSALINSDLSEFKVKKTVAMSEVFDGNLEDIHAVISIGGEVLCASSSSLSLHMNNTKLLNNIILLFRNLRLSFLTDFVCKKIYKLPWEYPYIPKKLKSHIKIAFNTVGGAVYKRDLGIRLHGVRSRLNKANYLSVRDVRTKDSLCGFSTPVVYPDSAVVMAHFVNDVFLDEQSSQMVNNLKNENYICFQAAPKKVGATAKECVEVLRNISKKYDLKVKLLPIGYASGHDDIEFLREVEQLSNGEFPLLVNLNIWEIMSAIRYSKMYIGTSLHGAITALSFSVPHIGLNRKVVKLDKFLSDWSIEPFTRCYSILEVPDIFESALNVDIETFHSHSKYLIGLGLKNNHCLVQALGLDVWKIK